jgi:hypothetical protein
MTSTKLLDVPLYFFPDYENSKTEPDLVRMYNSNGHTQRLTVTRGDQTLYSRIRKKTVSECYSRGSYFRDGKLVKKVCYNNGCTREIFYTLDGEVLATRWTNGDVKPETPTVVIFDPETQTKQIEEFWKNGKVLRVVTFVNDTVTSIFDFPDTGESIISAKDARMIRKTPEVSRLVKRFTECILQASLNSESVLFLDCENESKETVDRFIFILTQKGYEIHRKENELKVSW